MPIDGSYGRLSAHNQRFKELRRKKVERRERKLQSNKLKASVHNKKTGVDYFKQISIQDLEQIKRSIQLKAKIELKKDIIITLISIILTCVLLYILVAVN